MKYLLLELRGSHGEQSVPCKLNNVRQTITPWTIKMDCLSVFERITANEILE